MKRKSINPTEWGLAFNMDQGEIIEDARRILHFSGQTAKLAAVDAMIAAAEPSVATRLR